jgi:DtxR family transcriptional regulator, Mn-dependent transcriptional regulator
MNPRPSHPRLHVGSSAVAHVAEADNAATPQVEDLTKTAEDYVKAVYRLELRYGSVSTKDLARRLGVKRPTVSTTIKRLAEMGLLDHKPYRGVALTEEGRHVALDVIRRHRLLETLLHKRLGLPWDRIHKEAEMLEHELSPALTAYIDKLLKHPEVDPHGAPIPAPGKQIDEISGEPLDELPTGAEGELVRVSDSDPEMLEYLSEHEIGIDKTLKVVDRQPFGGSVLVSVQDRKSPVPIGRELASLMRIKPLRANGHS